MPSTLPRFTRGPLIAQAGWLGYTGRVYPLSQTPGLIAEPRGHRPLYAAVNEPGQDAHHDVVALLQLVDMTDPESTEPLRLTNRGVMFDPADEGMLLAQVGWVHSETGEVYPLGTPSTAHGTAHGTASGEACDDAGGTRLPLYVSVGVLAYDTRPLIK